MRYFILLFSLFSIFACGNNEAEDDTQTYSGYDSEEQKIKKGKVLFATNCKLCHAREKENATGMAPVLDSINYYWEDKALLAKYIANAPATMSETPHTRKLYQEWKGKAQMPAFSGLSKDDIDCIISYISQ